jgi:hypothetical protein
MDDGEHEDPNHDAILKGIDWLVGDAQSGDALFMHCTAISVFYFPRLLVLCGRTQSQLLIVVDGQRARDKAFVAQKDLLSDRKKPNTVKRALISKFFAT